MFFINLFVFIANIWRLKNTKSVRTITPKRNYPPVRFRVWLTVRVRIRVGGGEGAIFLGGRETVAESTKILFFKESKTFEEAQFWKVGVVILKLYLAWQVHIVSNKKWFLLTYLLSSQIFECWKIWKSCFSSKIVHFSRHTFKQWACSILKFALLNRNA